MISAPGQRDDIEANVAIWRETVARPPPGGTPAASAEALPVDLGPTSGVWFVDDGSTDGTCRVVEQAAKIFPWAHGIKPSRNQGHQNALLAGPLSRPRFIVEKTV